MTDDLVGRLKAGLDAYESYARARLGDECGDLADMVLRRVTAMRAIADEASSVIDLAFDGEMSGELARNVLRILATIYSDDAT